MSDLKEIKANMIGVGKLLAEHRLTVPIHQRSYAWKKDHVDALLKDISQAISHDKSQEYFLGAIVSVKSSQLPEVLDGQQRLATCSVLMAAIRNAFLGMEEDKRARIVEEEYLLSDDITSLQSVPRLSLSDVDRDFFMKHVLIRKSPKLAARRSLRESHRNIITAKESTEEHLAVVLKQFEGRPQAQITLLLEWIEFIRTKVQVIWVQVPDYADAYTIFETLNDRGLELSVSDLLKNFLFGLADKRMEEARNNWTEMIGMLATITNSEISKNYIQQFWASRHGRTRNLFKDVKSRITDQASAIDFSLELNENAKLYVALRNGDNEYWGQFGPSARIHIHALNTLRIWQVRTILLAVLNKFTPTNVCDVLKLAVSWSVRFMIAGDSPGNVESAYTTLAKKVTDGEIKNSSELAKAMRSHVPEDEIFETHFSKAIVSASYLARFYLRCLEDSLYDEGEAWTTVNEDTSVVTLDHIMPEKPQSWHIDKDAHAEYVYRIGNLALLLGKQNSGQRTVDDSFAHAKTIYANSASPLTAQIAKYKEWGTSEIESRQKELAKLAVKVWPLSVSKAKGGKRGN